MIAKMQETLASSLAALFAYAMRGLAVCALWLQHVGECATTDIGQLVPLLLSLSCFKLSNFFFEQAYNINRSRLRRLGGEYARLGSQEFSLNIRDSRSNLTSIIDLYRRLDKAKRQIDFAAKTSGDSSIAQPCRLIPP